ncbi:hypothetical protein GJ744_010444, partial [Endocarpon pusillum]
KSLRLHLSSMSIKRFLGSSLSVSSLRDTSLFTMSTPQGSEAASWAQSCWVEKYNEMPFSTYQMIDFLIQSAGITYKQYVENPKLLQDHHKQIIDNNPSDFEDLLSQPGRCTTFAYQVVDCLQKKHPGVYDFEYLALNAIVECSEDGGKLYRAIEWDLEKRHLSVALDPMLCDKRGSTANTS